ncbi:MAG: sigma-70 family RNA polymerase sigma factor [Clostridia bacterium]|nr:sigma-70 family RNA polymerase sigma factor [Clostridia bacterium]
MPGRDFESIYRDYSRLVYWAAYKVLNSGEETEDAAQDVFLAVLKNMDLLSGMSDAQLKGWLYRVAVNAALDMKRRDSRELLSDEPLGAEVADTGETPEDEAVGNDTQAEVRAALSAVDEIYREPLYMYYYSGMSVGEIAEALEISEGTVKSRMARGRKIMAKRLNARGISYE